MSRNESPTPEVPPPVERSGTEAPSPPPATAVGRRQFLTRVGGGVVTAAFVVPAAMAVRSLVPNSLYEKPLRFKAGPIQSFAGGPTFVADQRVFIFREGATFHCISAVCTHLGCTVQLVRLAGAAGDGSDSAYEFACPCHGSKYRGDGTPYAGPAPRPLSYFKLFVALDDGQLVVDLSLEADRGWRLTV